MPKSAWLVVATILLFGGLVGQSARATPLMPAAAATAPVAAAAADTGGVTEVRWHRRHWHRHHWRRHYWHRHYWHRHYWHRRHWRHW